MENPDDINYLTKLVHTSNSKTKSKLPKPLGQKSSLATSSVEEQEKKITQYLEDYKTLLDTPRTSLEKNLSIAVYDEEDGTIKVRVKRGGNWIHLGHNNNGQTFLGAEEALYMMECGVLQVVSLEGVPWTMEKVFSYLRRSGYITQIVNLSKQLADTDKVIYVYKPQKSFKKSSPGEPNIVVIVTKPTYTFPSSEDLVSLKDSFPNSEVQYAVVDGDNITFYSLYALPSLPIIIQ